MPNVWPFPTYMGQPYKKPRCRKQRINWQTAEPAPF